VVQITNGKLKKMKKSIAVFLCLNCFINLHAQQVKKTATIGLHFFYNDFATAQNIGANNLNFVIKNNLWSKPHNLQGGFGIDYLQGVTKKIDAVGTFNASWVDYLLPGNVLYGSSNFLMDVNAGTHIKLFTDKRTLNPFLITKAGFSTYKNISGFSLLPGAGVQVNVFNEVLILTTAEYRLALSNHLSNQFYYSIGIATSICNKKIKTPKPAEEKSVLPPAKTPDTIVAEIKIPTKDIAVTVSDEATGQPLQYVEVSLKSSDGNIYSATTNEDGKATIANINQGDYTISGRLNKIDASTVTITKGNFSNAGNQIPVTITHNDPRFTLIGNTVDKAANKPVGNTTVTITNSTQSSTAFASSNIASGEFRTQLEAASDFEIVGKKANYISNIENLSTKGLNRSATLYVKLQLNIEEAKAGATIVLNKIYFETGKAIVNTSSSGDLNKLVQFLKDNPNTKLEIQGHTDNVGTLAANTKLSQLRANSIVNYIVKSGIGKERLLAKGYGPSMPIAGNDTKEGKAQNRRVEMKVLE
jgi:outer membrane protein OmpA-like peptidoglycan-associated protein